MFPVVFFLVAALVALTTMTRMVDEERGIIGTYKALGYSNAKIGFKYLFYAAFATVLGSALGIGLGMYILPQVVWNAYGIVFFAARAHHHVPVGFGAAIHGHAAALHVGGDVYCLQGLAVRSARKAAAAPSAKAGQAHLARAHWLFMEAI